MRADPGLALAVIAVAPSLQDERDAELGDCRFHVFEVRYRAPGGDARLALLDELFFARAILRDGERYRARSDLLAEQLERFDRDIFKFIGRDTDGAPERFERRNVGELGARERGRDVGRGRMLVRVEDVAAVAELGRGHAEHPAELAAADDADGGAGRDRHP